MGAEINGISGRISAPKQKKMEVAWYGLELLGKRWPTVKARLMVLGRLVRCFEFRRPLMSLLHEVWPRGPVHQRQRLSAKGMFEVLQSIALLPLAGTDLRAQVDPVATCSDASESGGGLCASGALTQEGQNLLKHLQSPEVIKERLTCFSPLGGMEIQAKTGPRIFVLSLFDGVAALMCALCRLDCQVIGFASSEVDVECKRLVRRRWPGVIELGDIKGVSRATIEALSKSLGYQVDLVLAGGGSPCQDLSSLLANRQGLSGERSKLFYEMPRIFQHLRECFSCPVFTFVENVQSMSDENRDNFTAVLGRPPILIDSHRISWCRRPRYFLVDWHVNTHNGETMVEHRGFQELVLPVVRPPIDHWVDSGCTFHGTGPLPTLTRSLPNKKPPRSPAGLAGASPSAVARWSADDHRFQVYQYEEAFLVQAGSQLRTPSLTERERLMGFDRGYIHNCLNPKWSVQKQFDVGASMIGNSFNVHVMTILIDSLLDYVTPLRAPRDHVQLLQHHGQAPAGWCALPEFVQDSRATNQSRDLIQEFLRAADKGGSDVKLSVGIPYRIKAWLRAGIQTQLFEWRLIHGYPWTHPAHINVLEMQAVVNSLQWRLRSKRNFRKRVLHLVNSQVVCSIIVKGRSSSRRLAQAIKKLSALCLAGGVYLSTGYVSTHDNPVDIPSRWECVKRRSKHAKGNGGGSPCKSK